MPGGPPANQPGLPGRFLSALGPVEDFEYATRPAGTVNPTNKRTIKVVALVVRQPEKSKNGWINHSRTHLSQRDAFQLHDINTFLSLHGCVISTCKSQITSIHSAS